MAKYFFSDEIPACPEALPELKDVKGPAPPVSAGLAGGEAAEQPVTIVPQKRRPHPRPSCSVFNAYIRTPIHKSFFILVAIIIAVLFLATGCSVVNHAQYIGIDHLQ